jgi:hypothetical protein
MSSRVDFVENTNTEETFLIKDPNKSTNNRGDYFMKNMRTMYCIALLLLFLPVLLFGQELRLAPYSGQASSYLNAQIAADTVANGKLANRVYVLTRGSLYLANAVFTNTGNWVLRLKANDSTTTKKPVIMLYPTGTGATPWNPPGNLFQLGGSLSMKNLEVTGYYELVDTNRWNMQGALINIPATASGLSITIDSCILSNANGNHIRTDGVASTVRITNTVFANLGYLGRSNFGAGKAIDLRNVSCDTLIMQNCTFVNWLDRIVRHYPATGATSTGTLGYFLFDHNTLINGTSYHGLLSLGSVGSNVIITNNLFYDPFILGNDSDATRQVEYIPSGELDRFGGARMTWIFSYPNTTTKWAVSNNFYCISDSGQAFYNQFASAGVTGEGSPLTWHINGKLGSDSVNAFKKITVALNKIPATMTQLARWYRAPNGGNKLKNTPGAWTYGNASDPNDFDRKGYAWLRDSLNGGYSSAALLTGAQQNFPVGDLNWFPTQKVQWLATQGPATAGPASVVWNLILPDSANPSTTVGSVLGQPISGNNFFVRNFAGTPNGPLATSNMRWWPSSDGGVTGTSWGPETGEVVDRWIQLQAAPKTGASFAVDSVSFWSCGGGTGSMRMNVYYSTDGFATKTRLNADTINLPNSGSVTATNRYAYKVGTTVPSGKTFSFRIYPWYTGASSNSKYVYTQLVSITGSTTTATAVKDEDLVPRQIQLAQNYPNPFNPSTTMQFAVTKSGHVSLDVFNILGQHVATLVNEVLTAGTYHVNFDGSALSSGVYLYRLQAGDVVQTKKMVLMK